MKLKAILMNNGIINLLKPAGMTSFDAVSAMKRIFQTKKVGHTGTLDPMATGVLPICIDKGTRIIKYLENDTKSYRCEVLFGFETDTQDAWGKITKSYDVNLKEERLIKATEKFIGKIQQTPPNYSAIRINGRRAYEYARNGEEITPKAREINIEPVLVIKIDLLKNTMLFDIEVSKGTYIRTICAEMGRILECGGIMTFLSRTRSGIFNLKDTTSFENLELLNSSGRIDEILLPLDFPLSHLVKAQIIEPIKVKEVMCGGYLKLEDLIIQNDSKFEDEYLTLYFKQELIAISKFDKSINMFKTDKVFSVEKS